MENRSVWGSGPPGAAQNPKLTDVPSNPKPPSAKPPSGNSRDNVNTCRKPEVVPHCTLVAPKAAGLKCDKPEVDATEPDVGWKRAPSRQKPPASSATYRTPMRQSQIWARYQGLVGLFFLFLFCKALIAASDLACESMALPLEWPRAGRETVRDRLLHGLCSSWGPIPRRSAARQGPP